MSDLSNDPTQPQPPQQQPAPPQVAETPPPGTAAYDEMMGAQGGPPPGTPPAQGFAPPAPPPPGTAAYQQLAGAPAEAADLPKVQKRKIGASFGALGLLVGLAAGLGVGFGVWNGSGASATATLPNGVHFPGFAGGEGFHAFPGGGSGSGGTFRPFANGPGSANATGASGKVAQVSGNTVQVQNSSGQTAVTVNGSTTITQTTNGSLSDISPGSCVTAFGTKSSNGTVKATRLSITQPTNGACPTGAFSFRGGPGAGGAVRAPSGSGGPSN